MSIANQLSMPGKVNYSEGTDADGIISYNLDTTLTGNLPVTADVFEKGVEAFLNAGDLPVENICYTFDKQLLLILLSFGESAGLSFYHYLKPDGSQSLAVVAVDNTGTPIRWDKVKGQFGDGDNGFVGADFTRTQTKSSIQQFLTSGADGGFDFAGFITSLGN